MSDEVVKECVDPLPSRLRRDPVEPESEIELAVIAAFSRVMDLPDILVAAVAIKLVRE